MTVPTLDEIYDTLLENADFEQTSSVSKAEAFITAANRFFILSPQNQSSQGGSMSINTSAIQDLLARARLFVEGAKAPTSNTSAKVRFFSFGDFR
jgi:hypothetical protein